MACTSAICYSSLTILVKLAYTYKLSVSTIVVLRMFFASAFLWLTLLFSGQKNWRISRRDWLILFAGMVLAFGGSQLTYFTGLQTVAAGVANFLVYLYAEISMPAWLVMLATGLLPTCALLLYFGAIGRIGAARTALISTIEPVSTAVIAALVLNERFTPWQVFGAVLILSGLVALEWQSVKQIAVNRTSLQP